MKRFCSLMLILLILSSFFVIPIHAATSVAPVQAAVVKVSYGRLNVRAAPSTSSTILAALPSGTTVTLYEREGDFFRVGYGQGKTGYCHAAYLSGIGGTAATVATASSPLNVRRGPGTAYARKSTLASGEAVVILSSADGWAYVLYHGKETGYVSTRYLKTAQAYPALSLSVPVYRQTDSRWSWVTLGASGLTVGRVGCATSGIAMMESYRTGTTLTPATMAARLSYTATGNVYWPSHYTATYTLSLSAIYRHLSAGRPVLLGAKTASGGQHWVVVTGYVGADTLREGGFLIHDPGTARRTTLADFFADYPYFYKYFTY